MGIYGVGQAAELLGLRSQRVRAWLDGYERAGVSYPPVVREERTGVEIVTWGEFIELGYLREYRHAGVSLQALRPVISELRERYNTPYPLATQRPYVADKELVMQLQDEHGVNQDIWMVVRSHQQLLLSKNTKAFLRKVEFNPAGVSAQWKPAGKQSPVTIDPEVSFGLPAVQGVSTERIFEAWSSEGEDTAWVAESYDIDEQLVRAALSYEETFRAVAA
jgi:uncharacterized protein (DUF433 family)